MDEEDEAQHFDAIPPPRPPRRADTFVEAEWQQQNILSLDGGGIRGYWSLLVLERLMEAIGEQERFAEGQGSQVELHSFLPNAYPENVTQCDTSSIRDVRDKDVYRFLPCHYFDLICGSSTGSLIAIMLSRFRMTVKDCLDEYERMSNQIFGNPRILSQRNTFILPWTKYSASAMAKAFQDVTARRCSGAERDALYSRYCETPKFETTDGACSMFATTFSRSTGGRGTERSLYLLRSYEHENTENRTLEETLPIKNFGPAEPMQIWQVARAATAAPLYFKEIVFRPNGSNDKIHYSDGGFGTTNNPTHVAMEEINLLHGANKLGVILSVGTARADDQAGGQSFFAHTNTAYQTATDPNHIHGIMSRRKDIQYWRLNDQGGLNIPLDHWKPSHFTSETGRKTISIIRNRFSNWLRENRDVVDKFNTCAAELVRRRRIRAQHAHLWERYATGVSKFRCRNRECWQDVKYFAHRGKFDEHWRDVHGDEENATNCREPLVTEWRYQPRP